MEILRFCQKIELRRVPRPLPRGPVLSVRSFSTWKPPFFSAFFQWASWMQRKKQLQTLEPPRAEPSQGSLLWSRDPWKFRAVFLEAEHDAWKRLFWRLIDSSWCFVSCSLGRICGKAWTSKGPFDLTSPNLDAKNTFVGSNYLMEIDHFFFPIRTFVATFSTKKRHFLINSKSQLLSLLLPTRKPLITASVHRLPRFACLSAGSERANSRTGWHFRLPAVIATWPVAFQFAFFWVDSQEFLDLREFVLGVYDENYIEDGFWIQILGLCCMIACNVSMIVLAQYSTLCLLLNGFSVALSTKQNLLSTFISQVSPESLKRDLLLCWSQHFGPL